MERHILHRLLLAKFFIQDAQRAAKTSSNDLALSRVVVHLHDAIDNLLGAVATQRQVRVGARDAMMDVFAKLTTAGHLSVGRTELEQLNAMRNAIKHHGVPQNAAAVIALLPALNDFSSKLSVETFGVSLEAVSLADLIEDETTRDELGAIQGLISTGDFKTALDKLGLLRFQRLQAHSLRMIAVLKKHMQKLELRDQVLVFPKEDRAETKLECLELGINPDELTRFEWLTPKYGYRDMETETLIAKREGLFWHHRNWTFENAMFCFNFLVSYFAAKQRTPYTSSVYRRDFKLNEIAFIRPSNLVSHDGTVRRAYLAGECVNCWSMDLVDGEWQNHDEATARVRIYEVDGSTIDGHVVKADVTVGPDFEEMFDQPAG